TPLGLKAMASLQEINPDKTTASNSQIMFLVLNTAGFTLIPATIMSLRASNGAHDPTDVFIPILITTFCASLIGLILVAIRQKINLFDKVLLSWILGGTVFISGVIYMFSRFSPAMKTQVASVAGNSIILGIIVVFITAGIIKKQNVFDSFIQGAKEGFTTAIKIIPYLVGILIAVGMFRSCGAMDYLINGIAWCVAELGFDTRFVPSLPVAFMKPLSGGGTQGIAVDLMSAPAHGGYGVDSFVGRLASVMYASADTTLYIVALYFGSVGITKTRYAIGAGLLADLAGILAAIFVSYLFWG
ncbi:MAG TPA: nucleoside recognition domain-containing protein, partial [Bacteroidia bacterium]|nr:nucleoside recognition domain-containing protein [Bacteroidia bacterium]